ncbi:MAG: bifunctional (p)ppGpp synthetase/guanosine-3',5'-bis(diphosphate) 3'-pyrophosphohydrolase, partial [Gammaproteobacteria bacterium]
MDAATLIKKTTSSRSARSDGFTGLFEQLESYLPASELPSIVEAYNLAAERHKGQFRRTGDPYITHPVAAARILADLHLESSTIKAALLHDVVEDTQTSIDELSKRFGEDVALLVDGVSKLDKIRFDSALDAQAANFRKMLLAMTKDLRVILVKLADRAHNVQTLDALPEAKRRKIAAETLDIYAPIANRLGIYNLKVELEEYGFRARFPMRYRILSQQLRKLAGGQKYSFRRIETRLNKLLKENGIAARVISRQKNLYSIYLKMKRKRVHLSEIVDLFGMRIIVGDVDQCYRALGLVHQLFKPMPGRFKDYIAIPRVNGYQSLHTTLFGQKGVPIEIQIRTEEMNRVAERGIAANWLYKAHDKSTNPAEDRARQWLSGLVDLDGAADSEEFLETVRVDLFPDTVYVFTPRGEIKRLPRGATPIDFAYAVHTDVGNRCVSAKIDRRHVPLKTVLNSGDTVEIITSRDARPDPSWVEHVVTAKARNAIRARLKRLQQSEARRLGQQLLSQTMRPYSVTPLMFRPARLEQTLRTLGVPNVDALHEQIGLGLLPASLVASQLSGLATDETQDNSDSRKPLAVGDSGMVLSYAGCCLPIPGDDIVGFMSAGRGIVIHRAECHNLAEFRNHPSRWVPVSWKNRAGNRFLTEIQIRTIDRVGVLAEI